MKPQEHLDHLIQIRSIMEKSTRFLSLSGLSGVFAGTYALAGAGLVYWYLHSPGFEHKYSQIMFPLSINGILVQYSFFLMVAGSVLILSIGTGLFFTRKKVLASGNKIWNSATKRMAINLAIPLVTGAIFCFQLIQLGLLGLIAPSLLIFYGLALINGSKYTFDDIRYLGICEIVLGILAFYLMGYGLYFWAFGFGILHIVYGIIVYRKYEA